MNKLSFKTWLEIGGSTDEPVLDKPIITAVPQYSDADKPPTGWSKPIKIIKKKKKLFGDIQSSSSSSSSFTS